MKPLDLALWRYQVIASLLALPHQRGALKNHIAELAARSWEHPVHGAVRIGSGTIEEWYYAYRRNGLDGLQPLERRDKGVSRCIRDDVADLIERLAHGSPPLSGPNLLKELQAQTADRPALPSLSSLYRFLHARGLNHPATAARVDHRAFEFQFANDCWQGDAMLGPTLACPDGRRRAVHLLAFIDDATRVIPHAQFYFDESLSSFKDCLKQALLKRGVPKQLYLDNAQIFRARLIQLVAARLGFRIVHSTPHRPEGRGKIERFFRTVRSSFIPRLDLTQVADLDDLNRLLHGYVEGEYHLRHHRGVDQAPLDCWLQRSAHITAVPLRLDLDQVFHDRTTRRVAKDATFSLHGRRFEAGLQFIGRKIAVRFDPVDRRVVYIRRAEHEAEPELPAYPLDRRANRNLPRDLPAVAPLPPTASAADSAVPPRRSLAALADALNPPSGDAQP